MRNTRVWLKMVLEYIMKRSGRKYEYLFQGYEVRKGQWGGLDENMIT